MQAVKDKILNEVRENNILPSDEIWNVFGNLEEILEFNTKLFGEIQERVAISFNNPATVFSDIFLKRKEFATLYSTYMNNFEMASLMVKYNKKKFKKFKKIIKAFEIEQKSNSGLDLDSFLIVPVQRMPRYLLLLKELLKYTPESHPDYKDISLALEHIANQLETINENKRKAESSNSSHKILNIDKSMIYENQEGFEGIVHPKRSYLYEGVLKWEDMSEEAENPYWFLFNDIIVFCADISGTPDAPPDKQFRYITLMPLKFIDEVNDNEDNPLVLDIVMEDEIISLEANDVDTKNIWKQKIQEAINLGVDLDLVW